MTITVGGASLLAYLLATLRIGSWLVLTPPFNTKGVPSMAKATLSLGLSFAIAPTLAGQSLPTTTPQLIVVALIQVLVGAAMGFVTQMLFSAISTAGALIDVFGGFQIAAAFDPLGMNSNSVFGRFHEMIAVALLVGTGAHLVVIGGLMETFRYLPVMAVPDLSTWPDIMTTAVGLFMSIAVEIALPLIAVLFIADLGLGLLTKIAPALSATTIMYPAKIGLTLLLVGLSFAAIPHAMDHLVDLIDQATGALAGR